MNVLPGDPGALIARFNPLHYSELTDAQWAILDPLIPERPRRKDGRGRPLEGSA